MTRSSNVNCDSHTVCNRSRSRWGCLRSRSAVGVLEGLPAVLHWVEGRVENDAVSVQMRVEGARSIMGKEGGDIVAGETIGLCAPRPNPGLRVLEIVLRLCRDHAQDLIRTPRAFCVSHTCAPTRFVVNSHHEKSSEFPNKAWQPALGHLLHGPRIRPVVGRSTPNGRRSSHPTRRRTSCRQAWS